LLRKNLDVPEIWRYEPEYKINYKFDNKESNLTTAQILAVLKIIVPEYYNHDPLLKDEDGNTIAMIFA